MSHRDPLGPAWPRPPLSLRSRPSSGRVRVEATGEMDLLTTPMVLAVIDAVVRVHHPTVVELDLTRLSFLSSSGVTALVKAANRLHTAGRRLEVSHPHGAVLRVLTLTNTLGILRASNRDPGGAAAPAVRPTGTSETLLRRRPTADPDVRHRQLTAPAVDDPRPPDRQRRWQATDQQPRP